ncbi:12447_t:CDS:2 [Cetraspora pellucida]|uniref:12447_t:CDS:1 n=1 Tax=Cetraspora pellucida TaxID=1433469 RepID=A0A9N8ZT14_9GLOM|nr:12447_t:CDS:2 [Cetraspora pellucida]
MESAINIAQEQGGKCLSTEYKNSNTPMLWHCIKGHKCKGSVCLSTEYKNLNVLMQWKYDKDHKWFASFNDIKHARSWCLYCLNKHENLCCDIITNILGPLSGIYRPDFLKTLEYPQGLELDIYYPQHRLAIEVQDIQHRQYRKCFYKNKKDFEKQLIHDQLKKELCKEN